MTSNAKQAKHANCHEGKKEHFRSIKSEQYGVKEPTIEIYVDRSCGNDCHTGLSPKYPIRSLTKAILDNYNNRAVKFNLSHGEHIIDIDNIKGPDCMSFCGTQTEIGLLQISELVIDEINKCVTITATTDAQLAPGDVVFDPNSLKSEGLFIIYDIIQVGNVVTLKVPINDFILNNEYVIYRNNTTIKSDSLNFDNFVNMHNLALTAEFVTFNAGYQLSNTTLTGNTLTIYGSVSTALNSFISTSVVNFEFIFGANIFAVNNIIVLTGDTPFTGLEVIGLGNNYMIYENPANMKSTFDDATLVVENQTMPAISQFIGTVILNNSNIINNTSGEALLSQGGAVYLNGNIFFIGNEYSIDIASVNGLLSSIFTGTPDTPEIAFNGRNTNVFLDNSVCNMFGTFNFYGTFPRTSYVQLYNNSSMTGPLKMNDLLFSGVTDSTVLLRGKSMIDLSHDAFNISKATNAIDFSTGTVAAFPAPGDYVEDRVGTSGDLSSVALAQIPPPQEQEGHVGPVRKQVLSSKILKAQQYLRVLQARINPKSC